MAGLSWKVVVRGGHIGDHQTESSGQCHRFPKYALCRSPPLLCFLSPSVVCRNTKVGCVTAASYAGALVAFSVSPAIMRATDGWESVFYAFGGGSLLLIPAWLLLPLNMREGVSIMRSRTSGAHSIPADTRTYVRNISLSIAAPRETLYIM